MAATTLQAVYSSAIATMKANVLMMPLWCGTGPAAVPRFGYRFRPKAPGARSPRTDPSENGQSRGRWPPPPCRIRRYEPMQRRRTGEFRHASPKISPGLCQRKGLMPSMAANPPRMPVSCPESATPGTYWRGWFKVLVGIGYVSARGSLRQSAWEPLLARRVWIRHVRNG